MMYSVPFKTWYHSAFPSLSPFGLELLPTTTCVWSKRFGEDLDLLHGFGDPFTEEAGAKIVDGFTFEQKRTNTAHTLEGVVSLLEVSIAAATCCCRRSTCFLSAEIVLVRNTLRLAQWQRCKRLCNLVFLGVMLMSFMKAFVHLLHHVAAALKRRG